MKIAVLGGGAIGSVVAAFLSKAGEDVTLVARKEHVEAIQANGLRVKGFNGDETIKVKVLTKLDQNYDLVIFTVKTQDIEDVYSENADFLDDNSTVLSTQNGVQADNILTGHFHRDNVYSSIVMFGATYTRPGEVVYNFPGDWIVGKPFMVFDSKGHKIIGILKKAFNIVVSDDIIGMKYLKLFVNFNNCIPALLGQSMQEVFADMDLCRLSVLLLKEGVDIVSQANIKLVSLPAFAAEKIYGMAAMPVDQAAGIINQTLTKLSKEPLYGSILQSIMRKRPSEIDFINGEVAVLARQMQKRALLNERVVELVHEVEQTGKYFSKEEIKEKFKLQVTS